MTALDPMVPAGAAALTALRCRSFKRITRHAIGAYACSWAGDRVPGLVGKMITFGGTHIALTSAFWPYRHRQTPTLSAAYTGLAVAGAAVTVTGQPSPALGAGLAGYSVLLITATRHALRVNKLTGAGMLCFTLSDFLVARNYLHDTPRWVKLTSAATYVAAQLLISAGVVCETNLDRSD